MPLAADQGVGCGTGVPPYTAIPPGAGPSIHVRPSCEPGANGVGFDIAPNPLKLAAIAHRVIITLLLPKGESLSAPILGWLVWP